VKMTQDIRDKATAKLKSLMLATMQTTNAEVGDEAIEQLGVIGLVDLIESEFNASKAATDPVDKFRHIMLAYGVVDWLGEQKWEVVE